MDRGVVAVYKLFRAYTGLPAIPPLVTSEARSVLLRDSPQVQIESPCGACTRESGYQEEIVAALSNNSQPFVILRAVFFDL